MSDLISRSALIKEFRKSHISFNDTQMEKSDMMISYRSLARVINKQPTVEAKPVEYGKWCFSDDWGSVCSNCGTSFDADFEVKRYIVKDFNFCPNCGCDMRKKVE